MNIPIFVINLPTDVARRQSIEKQLLFLNASYEFIEGIYGDDDRVTQRYDEVRAIKEHGKPLYKGEKGCALAHSLIYERIVKENIPYAVILEDDAILPLYFLSIIQTEVEKKHKVWDWLSFDYRYSGFGFLHNWFLATYKTIKKKPIFFFYACIKAPYMMTISTYEEVRERLAHIFPRFAGAKRFYRPLYNAGAYIISLEGAKKLLPFTNPIRMGADTTPNKARFKTNFNLLGYVPLTVSQNDIFKSSTVDWDKVENKDEYKDKYYLV